MSFVGRFYEKNRRNVKKTHSMLDKAKSVSGNDAVELVASAGAPIKRLKISGKSEQVINLEQFEKHRDYFTNLDNYVFGNVGYTYLIPFPEEWIGKELSFSLAENTKMSDISFELADDIGLLANTERLLDYNGNLTSVTSSAYTYFRFTGILSTSEISDFWENYKVSVVGLLADFSPEFQNANDNGMSVAVHSTNLATAGQIFKDTNGYIEMEYQGRNAIRYQDNGYTYNVIQGGFKENTQYTISGWYCVSNKLDPSSDINYTGYLFTVRYTDGSKDYKYIYNADWTKVTFTTGANKTVASIGNNNSDYRSYVYVDIDTFQINEGTEALPYEPYFRKTVEIPTSVDINDENVILRFAKKQNADYLLLENNKVKYYQFSNEETVSSQLGEQEENNPPLEYDLTRTEIGQALLSLCTPKEVNGKLEVMAELGDIPIELTYYSSKEADMVNITIRYVNGDGENITDPKMHSVRLGSKYLIVAPHIDGYKRVSTEVYGVADSDTVVDLLYHKE
ncbi:MAG: MucBP domain-containing protein [Clostridia bacterium]|nr:MucBP domain-containing protein [Clostridia bacterium]